MFGEFLEPMFNPHFEFTGFYCSKEYKNTITH